MNGFLCCSQEANLSKELQPHCVLIYEVLLLPAVAGMEKLSLWLEILIKTVSSQATTMLKRSVIQIKFKLFSGSENELERLIKIFPSAKTRRQEIEILHLKSKSLSHSRQIEPCTSEPQCRKHHYMAEIHLVTAPDNVDSMEAAGKLVANFCV